MTREANERRMRASYEAWNRDDVEGYLSPFHPEIEIRPVLGGNLQADVYRGLDGARRWMEDAKGEWEQFEALVTEVFGEGDRLLSAVRIRARGRASGARIEGEIFHLSTFKNGLVVSIEGFTERAEALRALESS